MVVGTTAESSAGRQNYSKYRDRPYARKAELARRAVTRGRSANLRLRRQAFAAARAGRPVAWLALVLYRLHVEHPKGVSPTTGRVAAVMAASGDFRSGRRSRPGRALTAGMLGVSDRTVERQWRVIERTGTAVRTKNGDLLSATQRAQVEADPTERNRWRDRQEWHLVIPEWVKNLPAGVDFAGYERRARELLAEIAYVSLPYLAAFGNTQSVENPGADLVVKDRVAPSPKGKVLTYLPLVCSSSQNQPQNRNNRHVTPQTSPRGNRSETSRKGRSLPTEAVSLARELVARGRFPWLRNTKLPMVAATLSRLATAATPWTARDVEAEVTRRLATTTFSCPAVPTAPVGYLRWLLAEADPARPPAQIRDAAAREEQDAIRKRTYRARKDAAARAARAIPAAHSAAGRIVQEIARRAGSRRLINNNLVIKDR